MAIEYGRRHGIGGQRGGCRLREELEAMRVALEETRVWCEGLEQRQARIAALFSIGSKIGIHV